MKFCLSIEQENYFIAQADQLRCKYARMGMLVEKRDICIGKQIVLDLPNNDEYELKKIQELIDMEFNVLCCVHGDTKKAKNLFQNNGIKFYNYQPVSTFYDLNTLIDCGVDSVTLVAPLTMDLQRVKMMLLRKERSDLEIRVVPHLAQVSTPLREDGLTGFWIHPRDLEMYEPYIHTLEFLESDMVREATLFEVYKKRKDWKNSLEILILNLNRHIDGRALRPSFTSNRLNCRQRCESEGLCHLCHFEVAIGEIAKERFAEIEKA